tara:strand:+ start:1736 stop:1942 length:207 start_codon:yes stop_codon:yes gene_type:complete
MLERVEKFLNKKQIKVDKELSNIPFPHDDCLEQRKFSYSLGQNDLILELRSDLGLKINAHDEEEKTID